LYRSNKNSSRVRKRRTWLAAKVQAEFANSWLNVGWGEHSLEFIES
jgi:hypothetical protein